MKTMGARGQVAFHAAKQRTGVNSVLRVGKNRAPEQHNRWLALLAKGQQHAEVRVGQRLLDSMAFISRAVEDDGVCRCSSPISRT